MKYIKSINYRTIHQIWNSLETKYHDHKRLLSNLLYYIEKQNNKPAELYNQRKIELSKLSFMVKVGDSYKLDILKFFKNPKDFRDLTYNKKVESLEYFRDYYENRVKGMRSNDIFRIESPFVKDPIINMEKIMKKINGISESVFDIFRNNKKDWYDYDITEKLLEIFGDMEYIELINDTDNIDLYIDNIDLFRSEYGKYSFIVFIDGVYKFDISKFISGGYKELFKGLGKSKVPYLLSFIKTYYEKRKSSDSQFRNYKYKPQIPKGFEDMYIPNTQYTFISPFVKDPVINIRRIMKKINGL